MNQLISQEEKYTPEAYTSIPSRKSSRKHKLILAPFKIKQNILKKMSFIRLNGQQEIYICDCPAGWLSMSMEKPVEAFEAHVKQARGEINV